MFSLIIATKYWSKMNDCFVLLWISLYHPNYHAQAILSVRVSPANFKPNQNFQPNYFISWCGYWIRKTKLLIRKKVGTGTRFDHKAFRLNWRNKFDKDLESCNNFAPVYVSIIIEENNHHKLWIASIVKGTLPITEIIPLSGFSCPKPVNLWNNIIMGWLRSWTIFLKIMIQCEVEKNKVVKQRQYQGWNPLRFHPYNWIPFS